MANNENNGDKKNAGNKKRLVPKKNRGVEKEVKALESMIKKEAEHKIAAKPKDDDSENK